jgi:hypothetical protein
MVKADVGACTKGDCKDGKIRAMDREGVPAENRESGYIST